MQAVTGFDARGAMRERLRARGRLMEPPPPARVPTWEQVVEAGQGAGDAVSQALKAERAAR